MKKLYICIVLTSLSLKTNNADFTHNQYDKKINFSRYTAIKSYLNTLMKNLNNYAICTNLYSFIRVILPKQKTILELGSGQGTKKLAKHYKMYSIEHSEKWLNKYSSKYIFAPIKEYETYRWYDINVLKKELPSEYDLILVDGPTGLIGREGFFINLDLFNHNVPIIIDDINREAEFLLMINVAYKLKKNYFSLPCQDKRKFGIILP